MSLSRPFRGPVLSEAIRDYVKGYILEHHLGPGASLPPETQLATELGVGRSSVREAVKALQALGIIEVRHGDGLYVREYNFDPILETISYGSHFDASTLAELAQIRKWLELEIIGQAIEQTRPEHIVQMEAALEKWRESIDDHTDASAELAAIDRDFHRALYAPLGNESLIRLLEVFWMVPPALPSGHSGSRDLLEQRAAILRAFETADPAAARRAVLAQQPISRMYDRAGMTLESARPAESTGTILRRPTLNASIRRYIKQYILDHDLRPGDALLTEVELASDLGVGRTSVREAVKSLQSLGIVEVRHGGGLYVREFNFDPVLEVLGYGIRFDTRTLAELLEIRMWLETAVIEDAVHGMTPADVARLEAIIEPWEKHIAHGSAGIEAIKEWDQAFHRALYTPLDNETLVKLIDVFWMAFGEFVGDYRNDPVPDLEEHKRILDAVRARDVSSARRAIRQNIARNQERFRIILASERC